MTGSNFDETIQLTERPTRKMHKSVADVVMSASTGVKVSMEDDGLSSRRHAAEYDSMGL